MSLKVAEHMADTVCIIGVPMGCFRSQLVYDFGALVCPSAFCFSYIVIYCLQTDLGGIVEWHNPDFGLHLHHATILCVRHYVFDLLFGCWYGVSSVLLLRLLVEVSLFYYGWSAFDTLSNHMIQLVLSSLCYLNFPLGCSERP